MIDSLPTEALTTLVSYIGGAISFAGIIFAAVKSKRIPLTLTWGIRGDPETPYVTEKMLRENCKSRQTDLNGKLDTIVTKIEDLKDGFTMKIHQHDLDIAVIKEHMRIRRSTDRAAA